MRRAPLRPSPRTTGSHLATLPAEGSDVSDRPLVLVIGHDPGLRAEIRARVERGYNVAEAASVADGLALAGRIEPDLLVTNVSVPDLDGVSLLKALREDPKTAGIPLVLLSAGALADADALELATGLGRLLYDWEPSVLNPPPTPAPQPDAFVSSVDDLVREGMADAGFGTGALAERLGLSPRQLRRRLTLATGETPAQYIRGVRMETAAAMLSSGASAKQVGYAVGFASDSGFRSAFRIAFGVAPSAYASVPAA